MPANLGGQANNVKPFIQVGTTIFIDYANLKVLAGTIVGASALYCTPREQFSTSGYVVPAAKQLRIMGIRCLGAASTTQTWVSIGYGNTDIGMNSAAAPTSPLPCGAGIVISTVNVAANPSNEASTSLVVPTGKYPYVLLSGTSAAGGTHVTIFGYEETP